MAKTLIKSLTADDSVSLSFVDGVSGVVFDNTYQVYEFHIVGIHPETDGAILGWQVNATNDPVASGGGYDQQITSTAIRAYHQEDGSGGEVDYRTGEDQGNGVAEEYVTEGVRAAQGDESMSAILTIYDPSSTTFVKHFTVEGNTTLTAGTKHELRAGYINTTTGIDEIRFIMSADKIEAGTIKMFGVT